VIQIPPKLTTSIIIEIIERNKNDTPSNIGKTLPLLVVKISTALEINIANGGTYNAYINL
jgi:hypothetical protein